jgi:hypothetical protein
MTVPGVENESILTRAARTTVAGSGLENCTRQMSEASKGVKEYLAVRFAASTVASAITASSVISSGDPATTQASVPSGGGTKSPVVQFAFLPGPFELRQRGHPKKWTKSPARRFCNTQLVPSVRTRLISASLLGRSMCMYMDLQTVFLFSMMLVGPFCFFTF